MLPAIARVQPGSWLLAVFIATIGHLLMLQALRRAPLSVLTPFGYVQLAFAALFSWLLFGQVPDAWMAIGMCVIAASGIGTVLLHGRLKTRGNSRRASGGGRHARRQGRIR